MFASVVLNWCEKLMELPQIGGVAYISMAELDVSDFCIYIYFKCTCIFASVVRRVYDPALVTLNQVRYLLAFNHD